jgi:hypothetical protein
MKEVLKSEAANEFLRLTLVSYECGIIGREHFESRLRVLIDIGDAAGGAVHFVGDILGDGASSIEVSWPETEGANVGKSDEVKTSGLYFDDTDQSFAFRLIAGPLRDWEFHQADDDFFPSIPHGHHLAKKRHKLYAYLGWCYNSDKQIGRVDRNSIVHLWNDRDFRKFARIAINYYLNHHSKYTGWRVVDPRILPKIRRGSRF